MKNYGSLFIVCILTLLAGCTGEKAIEPEFTPEEVAATVLASMDATADPCTDFYRYACGAWMDQNPLPADKARYTRSVELYEKNRERIRGLLEELSANRPEDPDMAKLGDLYGSCMDLEAVEAAGHDPIRPMIEEIDAVDDVSSFMAMVGQLHRHSSSPLFGYIVMADSGNPDTSIVNFYQGGLSLPDRDYYLVKDNPRFQSAREGLVEHVANMMRLVGEDEASSERIAEAVMKMETALAEVSMPRQEARDPDKTYNKIDVGGLKELAPSLDWDAYFKAAGFPEFDDLNVMMPGFFRGAGKIVNSADAAELRAYLKWNLVTDAASLLSSAFVEEDFDFFGKQLSGQEVDEERWKKCSSWTTGAMGEQLGRIFVDRYFAGDSKEKALEMVHGIQAAFDGNLPALEWMDDITRAKAEEKSAAMRFKIGYPDVWRDYSTMKIAGGGFFDNIVEATRFEIDRNMKKIGQPVDKNEWFMAPSIVNAGYIPRANELMFPAGILQPPFFHRDHPPAMNFGGIGMVIGHELTHGFDDSGRKYDKTGQLQEWWEPQVSEAFEERAECIVEHASDHEVIPGVNLNGRLTLGENIADLGGLKQAYIGYKTADDPESEFMTDLTDDQLFFVAYAQLWCAHVKPEMAEQLVMADPHSDPVYRVIGPMQNYAAFAEAFQCDEGTVMNPEERCEVW